MLSISRPNGLLYAAMLAAGLAAGCEKAEPEPARRLPPQLLKTAEPTAAVAPTPTSKEPTKSCTPPFRGLDMIKSYHGLDQLTYPVFVPKSYDPKSPPPLVLFAPDRYFDVPAWLPRADLMKAAEEHGFVVLVVYRSMSATTGADLRAPVQALRKVVCFDEDRVYAVGAGSGANAAVEAACNGDVDKIVTSGARPAPPCPNLRVPHLHLVSAADETMPLGGAAPRPLSKHENRIREQNQTLTIIGRQLDREDLAATDGEGPTPCPPPDGVDSLESFVAGWCSALGCADAGPERVSPACEARRGADGAPLQVCRNDGGRLWAPSNPPYARCYGEPTAAPDYLAQMWSFLDER